MLKATSALAALMTVAIAGCSSETSATKDADSGANTSASAERKEAANSAPVSTASAGPELGVFGVKTEDMDLSVAPGDDFFQHVGGKWMDSFEIPSDRSSYGSFTVLAERSEQRVRSIIEDAARANAPDGSVEQKIGDYFASYLDVDAINANGLDAIAADLSSIEAIETKADVVKAFARIDLPAASPIAPFVSVDAKRPDQYSVYLTQSGLGMPNRNYYLDDKFSDKRELYKSFIAQILSLANAENAAERALDIYALEEKIAEAHWAPAKRRNRDLTYNLKSIEELRAFAPGVDWDVMFDTNGLAGEREFILREDDALQAIAGLVETTPVAVWRDYLMFHLLHNNADVLPAAFDEANFAFFGTQLRGTPEQRERWKRGVSAVNRSLGEAVGQVYVARYFPEDSKIKMDGLVKNLRVALDERLDTLTWMGEATKTEAHKKLEKFTPKIGYPDEWEDYSPMEVVRGDPYGNSKRAGAFQWKQSIKKLGGPIDRTEWGMTPQRVNAYYNPTLNEIVFPAAILQAPFFDPSADAAVNYGGIGAVIGHEIGHGFDDQGSKSDGDGRLRNWWTDEDRENFEQLTSMLGAQYASYEPVPGFAVNPDLTMGENIGDIGGLAMAYHAYKLSLNGEEAPVIGGFTGDQRFFLAWAQVWKRVTREEALKRQVETDPHSPARYRVNGVVRNMDAWYEAFNVSEENALYLAPEDRVQIW
ncbi:MAG: M13 family metallopeptidase [Pseudomonadota bacterium]